MGRYTNLRTFASFFYQSVLSASHSICSSSSSSSSSCLSLNITCICNDPRGLFQQSLILVTLRHIHEVLHRVSLHHNLFLPFSPAISSSLFTPCYAANSEPFPSQRLFVSTFTLSGVT